MTGFVKRGLPHTPTFTICNFKAVDLNFGQQEVKTWVYSYRKFQLHMSVDDKKVMVFKLDVCGRPFFAISVTIIVIAIRSLQNIPIYNLVRVIF